MEKEVLLEFQKRCTQDQALLARLWSRLVERAIDVYPREAHRGAALASNEKLGESFEQERQQANQDYEIALQALKDECGQQGIEVPEFDVIDVCQTARLDRN